MRITIVNGFFLPVPPVAGGAMEKNWWRLARNYAARGHAVTQVSRSWPGQASDEIVDGIRYLRIPGFDHRSKLWQNLLLDAKWGFKLVNKLPRADILITNTVTLPIIAPYLRPDAGRLVVNLNRFPKGQVRWYRRAARIQAASRVIADAATAQAPALRELIRIVPNPIEYFAIQNAAKSAEGKSAEVVTIGYFGRINPEKGMALLLQAAEILAQDATLPRWRVVLRGATSVAQGGGGEDYVRALQSQAARLIERDQLRFEPAIYQPKELYREYHKLDIFCYPTLAEQGEALPIAVLEAMAARLPVVVTDLACFTDHVKPGINGLVVPRHGDNPAASLAEAFEKLIRKPSIRRAMGDAARHTVSSLDDEAIADEHLRDYQSLLASATKRPR